jgi:hypothetical protein
MAEWIQITRDLMIALVGGLVGAAGGAWGAQAIAESSARRKERLTELRNVNALIQLSGSACNIALGYRKQFSIELLDNLKTERKKFDEAKRNRQRFKEEYHLKMNLLRFPIPSIPIMRMEEILFSRISSTGRELSIMQQIELSLQGLVEASNERSKLVEMFSSNSIEKSVAPYMYLGVRQPDGTTDQSYPSLVEALDTYAQDVAFFTHMLCSDLVAYGGRLRKKIIEESSFFDGSVPRVSEIDFSSAQANGLLPSSEGYESWLAGFTEHNSDADQKPR